MKDTNSAAAPTKKKRRRMLMRRKRSLDPNLVLDYKNPDVLKRFVTDRGKIIPRRISGATQEQQRQISLSIKHARFLAMIPSSIAHEVERGFAGEMQAAAQNFASSGMRGRGPMGGGHRGHPDDFRGRREGGPEGGESHGGHEGDMGMDDGDDE